MLGVTVTVKGQHAGGDAGVGWGSRSRRRTQAPVKGRNLAFIPSERQNYFEAFSRGVAECFSFQFSRSL